MKIQGENQVLGMPVSDTDGRRLGRVVALDCAPDPYTAAWFVLRLRGWRRRLRAVPAQHAQWGCGVELRVPYRRDQVLASPALAAEQRDAAGSHREVEAFYAPVPG